MIISFGWTTQYLPPNGTKDTTRRIWSDRTFKAWCKAWDTGRLIHQAVDKQLCYQGKRIGTIELIDRPALQPLAEMPAEDLIREGGMCDSVEEFIARYFGGDAAHVRFRFSPLEAP